MADIFISYARADRDRVERLAEALEREGWSVWWDRRIAAGSEFSVDIERELDEAKAVIVVWSKEAARSRWVKDEAGVAVNAAKLVPVSLDGAEPPIGFKQLHAVAYGLGGAQWDEIRRAVAAKIDGSDAPAPAPTAPRPFYTRPKIVLGAGALAATLALAYVLFPRDSQQTDKMAAFDAVSADTAKPVAAGPPPEKSIAVLPFADMSSGRDQEYFSDGVAEEILNALAGAPGLKVTGRTSSFAFKGQNLDLREIADTLGVAHILEGSVRKQNDRVRISAQLIRAEDGFRVWSDSFDGTLDDIFDLQERISKSIAEELQIVMARGAQSRLAEQLTDNKDAYDYFLQGRELVARLWGDDTMRNAVTFLERAVALDPEFADAWALLARANYLLPQYTSVPDETPFLEASEDAARRALALDPDNASALLALGSLRVVQHDFSGGRDYFDRALENAPNDSVIVFSAAFNRMVIGQTDAARALCVRALELNPTVGAVFLNCAVVELAAGNLDAAENMARRSVNLGFAGGAFTVADILAMRGDADAALAYLETQREDVLAYAEQFRDPQLYALAGAAIYRRDPSARAALTAFLDAYLTAPDARVNTVIVGTYHSIGRADRFMDTFQNHIFGNSGFVLSRIWDDRPESAAIRQHPDFPAFADAIGLTEAWADHGWPERCEPTDAAIACN